MMSCLYELNKRSADIQYFATKPTVCGLKFTNINNFWCIFKVVSFFFFHILVLEKDIESNTVCYMYSSMYIPDSEQVFT